ncbi:MAG TPA: recombination protein RecR [Firmicutes bacterium]|jgi:recombination protein RecR|nr:recombination protein RecR [Bacillota bacterium]
MIFSPAITRLIEALRRLPGIGPKTAQRLAFFVLSMRKEDVEEFAHALLDAKKRVRQCSRCFNLTEEEVCSICRDPRRESTLLCVVQEARDIYVIEKTGQYRGLYFVLHGALSPLEGIGPEELKIPRLLQRLQEGEIKEVIMATNPNVEGDATAFYIAESARPLGVKVMRIGFGLPVGGDLEYADQLTMSRALEARREMF